MLLRDVPFFKDGQFLHKGGRIIKSKEPPKNEPFGNFLQRCRQKMNPSDFLLERVPPRIWGVGILPSLGGVRIKNGTTQGAFLNRYICKTSQWRCHLKWFQLKKVWTGFEPMTLRYRCSALTDWAINPAGSWASLAAMGGSLWSTARRIFCDPLGLPKCPIAINIPSKRERAGVAGI